MSGAHGAGTGAKAHRWVDGVQELAAGVEVRVRHELEPYQAELIAALGASYVIDPEAPACSMSCGHEACAGGVRSMAGYEKAARSKRGRSVHDGPEVRAAVALALDEALPDDPADDDELARRARGYFE